MSLLYQFTRITQKNSKNLRVSPENPFDWKFLKIGSVIIYSLIKNVPNLQVCQPVPTPPTALMLNAVSYSWYN